MLKKKNTPKWLAEINANTEELQPGKFKSLSLVTEAPIFLGLLLKSFVKPYHLLRKSAIHIALNFQEK